MHPEGDSNSPHTPISIRCVILGGMKLTAKEHHDKRVGWAIVQRRVQARRLKLLRECGVGAINLPVDTTPRLVRPDGRN